MSLAYIRSRLPDFLGGSSSPLLIPEPPQADPEELGAAPPIAAHRLDFVQLGLPEYKDKFAMVIDNLFTPEDCVRYVAAAEASKEWEVAAINGGQDLQYVDTTYRNSSRIMLDDRALSGEILEKLRPYLKDIAYMKSSPLHRTYSRETKTADEPPARLVTLNERLRFLKYGSGQFFRKHCDGIYYTPDRKQGGATRFWKSGNVEGPDRRKAEPGQTLRKFVDVEPRTGRALIFEQRGLVHSGEDVKSGIKLTVRTDLMYEACSVLEEESVRDN